MATPVKDRIRTAAINTAALTALLGTNPFRWFDRQLYKGATLPAVVVQSISDPRTYALAGRLPTSFSRYQFTIWADNNAAGVAALSSIESALTNFLETLDLVGIPGQICYSNRIVAARDAMYPTPEPGKPQRVIDAMIFANDSL